MGKRTPSRVDGKTVGEMVIPKHSGVMARQRRKQHLVYRERRERIEGGSAV